REEERVAEGREGIRRDRRGRVSLLLTLVLWLLLGLERRARLRSRLLLGLCGGLVRGLEGSEQGRAIAGRGLGALVREVLLDAQRVAVRACALEETGLVVLLERSALYELRHVARAAEIGEGARVLVGAGRRIDARPACCVAIPDVRLLRVGLVVDAELVEV